MGSICMAHNAKHAHRVLSGGGGGMGRGRRVDRERGLVERGR